MVLHPWMNICLLEPLPSLTRTLDSLGEGGMVEMHNSRIGRLFWMWVGSTRIFLTLSENMGCTMVWNYGGSWPLCSSCSYASAQQNMQSPMHHFWIQSPVSPEHLSLIHSELSNTHYMLMQHVPIHVCWSYSVVCIIFISLAYLVVDYIFIITVFNFVYMGYSGVVFSLLNKILKLHSYSQSTFSNRIKIMLS